MTRRTAGPGRIRAGRIPDSITPLEDDMTDQPTCNAARPGDGDPRTGIPHCILPTDHVRSEDRVERMHSSPVGPDGWTRWGDNYRALLGTSCDPDDDVCGDPNDGDWCDLEPGHDGHHRADTAEWAADGAVSGVAR